MHINELIPILQVAIGPVILISGIGLLLLSMTNRFGRVTDRSRLLIETLRNAPATERDRLLSQIRIFSERGKLIRMSISLAVLSILLASILVIAIFLAALLRVEAAVVLAALFIACLATLIGSLVLFLRDINVSLAALRLEMESAREISKS